MNQNVRISLYIVIPIIFWMLSGIFVEEKDPVPAEDSNAASIEIRTSTPTMSVSYTHLTLPTMIRV